MLEIKLKAYLAKNREKLVKLLCSSSSLVMNYRLSGFRGKLGLPLHINEPQILLSDTWSTDHTSRANLKNRFLPFACDIIHYSLTFYYKSKVISYFLAKPCSLILQPTLQEKIIAKLPLSPASQSRFGIWEKMYFWEHCRVSFSHHWTFLLPILLWHPKYWGL